MCEKTCQYVNHDIKHIYPLNCYSFVHSNQEVRSKSSSGGIFICLAEEIINKNGVVFGACFDEQFNVCFSYAESLKDCWKFVGSKYVQAKIGNTYKLVKKFLLEGRFVLFSGTPCQINGLNHYLGKKYDNLLKIDFTCHAIPSPLVWSKYLESIKGKYSIQSVNFRDKKISGWNNYGLTIMGVNGDEIKKLVSEGNKQNLYMKGFLNYLYDRPSCSNCVSRGFSSDSDIMIGDFWNVEKYHTEPFFNDDNGVSIAMSMSEIGDSFLKKLNKYGNLALIPIEEVEMKKSHDCILKSAPQHFLRNGFFMFNRIGLPLRLNIWICLNVLEYPKKIYRTIKKILHLWIYTSNV